MFSFLKYSITHKIGYDVGEHPKIHKKMFWALGLKIFYMFFELGIIEKHRKDIGRHWKCPQVLKKIN
jgi:hypothetical protein